MRSSALSNTSKSWVDKHLYPPLLGASGLVVSTVVCLPWCSAAYGMSSGGIDGSPADLSEQKLREMYLAPFEYLADGRGLRSVMAAQNMVNGRPMHCNKRLLTDILRTEWNVTGENTVATVGSAALQARLIHWNLCAVCRCTGRVGRL